MDNFPQATPDFNAELERQFHATEAAERKAQDWQAVADGQRARIDTLTHANAGLWGKLEGANKEVQRLCAIVGTETPIAAFDLVTTWHAEKAALMQECAELRASAGMAVERWKRSERMRAACLTRIAELEAAAWAVLDSAARVREDVLTVDLAALRTPERCVSSNGAGIDTRLVEETQAGIYCPATTDHRCGRADCVGARCRLVEGI